MAGIVGAHHRSVGKSQNWVTPKPIIDTLGPFDLDPCCPGKMPWQTAGTMLSFEEPGPDWRSWAGNSYSHGVDGLAYDWSRYNRVWLNPPYNRFEVGRWMERMSDHGSGIALVFARTDTAWFHNHVWNSPTVKAVLFLKGRIDFHRVDGKKEGNAGAPSCLIAYSESDMIDLYAAKRKGKIDGRLVHV